MATTNSLSSQAAPALDLRQSNVESGNPVFASMLSDLQANILKGHGRRFAYHIFLRLDKTKIADAKKWISGFAKNRVTSALKLQEGRQTFRATGADGGAVFTLSLSATGYTKLEIPKVPIEQETPANHIVQDLAAFPGGAKGSAKKLGDVQTDWEEFFREDVDVLVIVADHEAQKAATLADTFIQEVTPFSIAVLSQKGHVLYRKLGASFVNIEHFGYADGVSHPLYYKDEIDAQPSTDHWDDQEPLNLVLVLDPNGRDYLSFGSFLVFRKLEQNVRGFTEAEKNAIGPIKDSDGVVNADLPGAMMVGRFRNGNPVVTSGGFTGGLRNATHITNDFDYGSDPHPPASSDFQYSSKCPYFAHIRVTNPRSDITVVPPSFAHSVRLTRRSIPYQDDPRFGADRADLVEPSDEDLNKNRPSKGVGLLFMSYQAHIGKQFEFLQNNWANHGHIAGRNIGRDGVIGQDSDTPQGLPFLPNPPDLIPRALPTQWGCPVASVPVKDLPFGGFTKDRGGEYFFTPSISSLKLLVPESK